MSRIHIFSRDPTVGAWIPNNTKSTLEEALAYVHRLEAHRYDTFIEVDGRVVYDSSTRGEDLDP